MPNLRRLLALAVLLAGIASAWAAPPNPAAVRIGARDVLVLSAAHGGMSPAGRAARANALLDDLLLDPECGPAGWSVVDEPPEAVVLACGRRLLVAGPADAAASGATPHDLAVHWHRELARAFTEEKRVQFSTRLVRRALIGLLYPIVAVLVAWMIRLAFRRVILRLTAPPAGRQGLRIGPLVLLGSPAERRILATLLTLLQWATLAFFGYVFAVLLLRQFPRTAAWARNMLQPLATFAAQAGPAAVALLPRLVAALLLLLGLRLVLRAIGRLFGEVRSGRLRMEPFLSRDTAGPAEITARAAAIALALFLALFLVPGESRYLFAIFVLLGLGAALGSHALWADLLGSVVVLYGRPVRHGQCIRAGEHFGRIVRKGFLNLRLETADGHELLLPYRWLLARPLEIVAEETAFGFRVELESSGGIEPAMGLFRHAATIAGLTRDDGEVLLAGVEDGRLVLTARWPVPRGRHARDLRPQFLEALVERADGLGIRVVSARPLEPISQ